MHLHLLTLATNIKFCFFSHTELRSTNECACMYGIHVESNLNIFKFENNNDKGKQKLHVCVG